MFINIKKKNLNNFYFFYFLKKDGFVLYEESRVCVAECLVKNCKICPNFYEETCTECISNYKLI